MTKKNLRSFRKKRAQRRLSSLWARWMMQQALFFYNGLMEKLQPYLDDGTLVCKSGQITFEETGILRWSMDEAQSRAEDMSGVKLIQDGEAPDIICTGFDGAAEGALKALRE